MIALFLWISQQIQIPLKKSTKPNKNKIKEIESNAKLSKMMMILHEKNENIRMVHEELEWYIREYYKKKNEIKILENRVFKNDTNNNINNLKDNTENKAKKAQGKIW